MINRQLIVLPRRLLSLFQFNWSIDWRSQMTGGFNNGVTGVNYVGFPRWMGSPTAYLSGQDIGEWQALKAQAQGRVGLFLVSMDDPAIFPLSALGVTGEPLCLGKRTAEGNFTSFGKGGEYEPFCTAAANYPIGSEEITLDMAAAGGFAPRPGQIMSTPNFWPFRVVSSFLEAGTTYTVKVQMPLREPISTGDVIRLRGKGIFQLMEDTSGAIEYGGGYYSKPQISFQEALSR